MVGDGHMIHFYHKNIIGYENRPHDFNELIITNWKSMVTADDLIIHLGDVIFAQAGRLYDILTVCPGKKILCRGNHDYEKEQWYKNKGFAEVYKHYVLGDILFSHKPMNIEEFEETHGIKIRYNIHGHFHSKIRSDRSESTRGDIEGRRPDDYPFYSKKHLRLSIEEEDYKPVLLEEFIKRHEI